MKVEVAVLGSPVPNKPTVSVDVKQHFNNISPSVWAVPCGSTLKTAVLCGSQHDEDGCNRVAASTLKTAVSCGSTLKTAVLCGSQHDEDGCTVWQPAR